jgi:hypothetical protein
MWGIRTWLAAMLLVSGTLIGISAAPASAAGCYAGTCQGHDPSAYGCSTDSITGPVYVYSGSTRLATLYNRYSIGCKANWATAQLTSAAISAGDRIYVSIKTTVGTLEFMCYPGPSNTGNRLEDCSGFPDNGYNGPYQAYTDMVDGTYWTVAVVCVYNAGNQVGCNNVGQ